MVRFTGLGLLLLLPLTGLAGESWPAWQRFQHHHISADGRVIDHGRPDKASTSEGQAYAMYFALVACEPDTFARLLRWTENNLADGDLSRRLPAWLWGLRRTGDWGVIDDNSASDADLWLAYTLLEAGRLWRQARYRRLALSLLELIRQQESLFLPGLGPVVLPGRHGFRHPDGTVRLNPSYSVLFHWRRFELESSRWDGWARSNLRMLQQASPRGLAPDWADYRPGEGLRPVETGSYDAIRVYLWLGMTHPDDSFRAPLLRHFAPMAQWVRKLGYVPEKTRPLQAEAEGKGPAGFESALKPFLAALGQPAPLPESAQGYYGRVLHLFAQSLERARPDARGRLVHRRRCG